MKATDTGHETRGSGFTQSAKWPLIGIILLAISLRVWGIDYGLPYLYFPDEPNKVVVAQNIFKTGDLNPHYFLKPSLFIYLNVLGYVPYYLVGKWVGVFRSPADIPYPDHACHGGWKDSHAESLLSRAGSDSLLWISICRIDLPGWMAPD